MFVSIATDPGQLPGTKMRLAGFISRMELCEQVQRTGFFFTRESAIAFRLTAILSHCIAQFHGSIDLPSQPSPDMSSSFQSSERRRAQQILVLMWPGSTVTTTLGRLELSWILERQKLPNR